MSASYIARLLDGNLLDGVGFFDLDQFRQADVEDAVFDVGFDLFGIDIVRKQQGLLEFLVGEFTAQVAAVVFVGFVLGFLFHFDMEVVLLIDMDLEIFLGQARSSELHLILFVVFNYIDGRGRIGGPFHPAVVEEIIEYFGQPAI